MLDKFFQLNHSDDMKEVAKAGELIEMLQNADHVKDIVLKAESLKKEDLGDRKEIFTKKTFENISFSRTDIIGIRFNECTFKDCLFVGTRFVDCGFRKCSFNGCNPHKIEFNNTYIDPNVFKNTLDTKEHANIGVYLFQQLYKNATEMEQHKFARVAEFNFNKWQRFLLNYKFRKNEISRTQYCFEWLPNWLFHRIAGYGLQFKQFAMSAIIVASVFIAINYVLWNHLGVVGPDHVAQERGIVIVIYYTVTMLGRFGDLAPGSGIGRILFLFETFFGLVFVALFLTWLGKQVWK